MFSVRVTDDALLRSLDDRLGSASRSQTPESPTWRFSVNVGNDRMLPGGKVAHGIHSVYLGCMRVFRGRDLQAATGGLIASMRDLACSVQNEFIRVRAGGVVFDDRALLLPSVPEPHLSALVATLVRSGGSYLGDELVKIDPVLRRVHPVDLPLLVDTRDLSAFPELNGRRATLSAGRRVRDAVTPRHAVTLAELHGRAAEPAQAGWIVFPSFEPATATHMEEIETSEALFSFARAALNLHVWGDRGLRLLMEILRGARVARLIAGSPTDGANAVTSWVREDRS